MGCCSSHGNQKNISNPTDKGSRVPPKKPPKAQQHDRTQSSQITAPQINELSKKENEKNRIDTPLVSEGNNDEKMLENSKLQASLRPPTGRGKDSARKREPHYDLNPKITRKNKIYQISQTYPVQKPYSLHSEWQKTLEKSIHNGEDLVPKILNLRNRNWIQEQLRLHSELANQNAGSLDSLVKQRHFIQLREHFSWLVWAVAQYYFNAQKYENKYKLPKLNSKAWYDGFEFKGAYLKVLPFEDAYFIQNELLALKYVQQELLELATMAPSLTQQYDMQGKDQLSKDVILPLLTGITCGGFLLFGSPIIYMQDLEQQYNLNASRALQNSAVNYNSAQIWQNQSQVSFSYLHNNVSNDLVSNSLFKFMPTLKSISRKNMIPIVDFEEFNQNHDEQNLELKYILVNLFDALPRLGDTSLSTCLIKFPLQVNEEIQLLQLPEDLEIPYNSLKSLLQIENSSQQGEELFAKKLFQKHGWEFMLVQSNQGHLPENFRATSFYNQKEVMLRPKGSVIIENYNSVGVQSVQDEEAKADDGNEQASRQYISPQKQSILRRQDSVSDTRVGGSAVVSGYYFKRDFKIKYSLNGHSYSTSLENMFAVGVEQVARVIEQSDNIYNREAYKELMHRKGLNLRFSWAVLVKLRLIKAREMVMTDILLRVLRKVVNEEVKIRSKVQAQQILEGGQALLEEYCQGNQIDVYREVLIFAMNAILQRKFAKQKQVFDEMLTGLFLSRLAILAMSFQLNLSKEELIYLESRDILEDILESASRNPVLFINSIQTYFNVEFTPDFLRVCRQDKLLLLSRSQPVTTNDLKQINLKPLEYYSIKEQGFFILARSITSRTKGLTPLKQQAKAKTKTKEDLIKSSFQRPAQRQDESLISQRSHRAIGPQGLGRSTTQQESLGGQNDQQDSKTDRNHQRQSNLQKDQLSTIRQYQNIDKEMGGSDKQIEEFSSPPLNAAKLIKLTQSTNNMVGKKNESPAHVVPTYDLSKLSKRANFQPKSVQEIIMPSIMYKLKTYLSGNPMYFYDEHTNTYVGDTLTVLKSYYEIPSLDVVNEWVIVMESFLKDVYSVSGSEQVLLEALVYQAILTYFFEQDNDNLFKVLQKIRDLLLITNQCSPECLVVIQILSGIFFEEQREAPAIEAERSYITSMIILLMMYGDPRGRGNLAMPYQLFIAWKLSLLSLAEDKKLHDSEFAEELFDACLQSLHNHKKLYKEQQLQNFASKDKHNVNSFEIQNENSELKRELFDIKKYKTRPTTVTMASIGKQASHVSHRGTHQATKPVAMVAEEKKSGNKLALPSAHPSLKSRSQVPGLSKRGNGTTQGNDKVEMSDIELELGDENKYQFQDTNFKNNEWYIGQIPFKHWSFYRQQIYQKMPNYSSPAVRKNPQELIAQKQNFKEFISKFMNKEVFFQWMLKFNPLMYQSGSLWSSKTIKDVVFNQNQQMVSSSSSSVVMSNHNFSHQSSITSSNPTSAKEKRNMHFGTYSQIFGRENGGISKSDMNGVLFTWGTDSNGQLGVNIISPVDSTPGLKILYPRMVLSLRDEIIKEICCGHSHTLIINISGQVFSWGLNEQGQLGLGPSSPMMVKKPVLNPFLTNVVKLSAGNEHSIALTKDLELYTWGGGGLTGTGDLADLTVPTKLSFFSKQKVQIAVCGGLHTIAVTKDGEIYSWGRIEGGQLGLPSSQIMNLETGQILTPKKIEKLKGHHVTQVACGEVHTIVLTKENKIFGWGTSNYGQLGMGFSSDSFEPGRGLEQSKVLEPQEITHLKNEVIKKIICGATFSLFQTDKGELFGCGMNDLGQLGLDTFMDDIRSLEGAKQGRFQTTDVIVPTKVICLNGIPIQSIACGENHALAISGDNGDNKNMVWAWGMYKYGQLGLGEVNMKMNPRPVQTLSQSHINKVACGSLHSMALLGDSSSISTFSPQFYANKDELKNPWQCDMKALSFSRDKLPLDEEQVPVDGESKMRLPK